MPDLLKDSDLKLKRYPLIPEDKFIAWDSADEYIISRIKSNEVYQNILIIEDEFGAIGLSLKAKNIYYVNDSLLSQRGILANYLLNERNTEDITLLSPYEKFPPNIDLIIVKVPKVNRYLEFILAKLNNTYPESTPIIAGCMVKYLNTSIYELFQNYLAEFQYSLSWKKAKTITGHLTGMPKQTDFKCKLKEFDITLLNFPNLFSYNRLDIGSRFLLNNIGQLSFPSEVKNIIDVGSANGILGLSLIPKFPQAKIWLTDITYSAFESASATINANSFNPDNIKVIIENSLDYFNSDFVELIVINPPFHQNHKVSIASSLQIFKDCFRVLLKDGILIVIANKHLGYHKHLKELFSSVEVVQENDKFVIIIAKK